LVVGNQIWIFKLLNSVELRGIDDNRLNTIRATGYPYWYNELKAEGQIWIDTQLQLDAAPAA
jgi:hypothetical protein